MDDATKAALDKARAVLAEAPEVGHDHTGPDPCPRCGGEPPETPALTSWHPTDNVIPLRQRIDSNEESE